MSRTLPIGIVLGFYWRAAWRYPRQVIGCLLSVPLTVAVNTLLPPLIVSDVLNRLSRGDFQSGEVWASFSGSLIAYLVVMFLGGMVTWRIVDYFVWRLEADVERDLARGCFRHLIHQSADFHANRFGGALVSQTTKLLSSYIRIADTTLFQMLPLVCVLGGIVLVMAGKAPLFALLLAVFSLIYMVIAVYASRPVRRIGGVFAAAESAQTGNLADAITNVMAIKSFAREGHESARFAEATDRTHGELLRLSRAHMRQMAYFGGLTSTISVLALVVAVYGAVSWGADVGVIFLIVNYTASVVHQLFTFSNSSLRTYNRAFGDASDMIRILGLESVVSDPERPVPVSIGAGEVAFDRVVFRHAGSTETLFDGLNLRIPPGEKVGLVGHSGAGKTSFTRLLLRFSDVNGGRILVDGQDIATITQADLRAHIAYVPQEPLLFHRSIRENIAYGRLDATEEQIRLAAARANVSEFVETLPDEFGTLVGERGVKLSGGQRQRIAIARAMLKDAPILLLDEATSALDSESEALIQDALWTLMEGRTTIVIAHRLSTIQRMDRIIVLDRGRIVETGSHQDLLANPAGIYATFWARQSGGFLSDNPADSVPSAG
ncbi:ABC transporter ATP-binding protein [Pseudonocardia eucalypti]|uniref:ABC transporter ATP-binding protein n=1 Tax=Pseudonocardia eucalypti TaxID=648755 RepID=A0ABP9Q6G7_9PSEU|nr:ATP-binding cassette subfamily B protein [Pseudonocardia eucalypti]